MSIVVMCPQCQTPLEVPGEMADQPVQCHHCLTVIERGGKAAPSQSIQVGASPVAAPASTRPAEPERPSPSPPHREPRAPFPVVPLLVLLLGIMFFFLVASVGFNVWFIFTPDHGFRVNAQAARAAVVAEQQRQAVEQAARAAELNAKQAVLVQDQLKKRVEDLQRERDEALQKLEELQKK